MTIGPDANRTVRRCAILAAAGGLMLIAGLFAAPQHVAISYLVAYTATLAIVLAMLLLVAIAHLSGAIWFVVLRRRAEAVIGALPMLAVFTLPFVILPRAFWPFLFRLDAGPEAAMEGGHLDPLYLVARTVAYWLAWLGVGELLLRASRRQDPGDGAASRRLQQISAVAVPVVSVTLTLAAFDWMMSLSPDWSSSVYGAYYFAGGMVAALALIAVLASTDRSIAHGSRATPEHLHALGRLTLAFVLFWGYLWYVQFIIIWIADIPREVAWYVVRFAGGWHALARILVIAGFAIPFITLLFRAAKRSRLVMGLLGVLLLTVHYLDIYWMLVPAIGNPWSPMNLLCDLGALAFIGGGSAAFALWRSAGWRSVPVGDPLHGWSLRYQAH